MDSDSLVSESVELTWFELNVDEWVPTKPVDDPLPSHRPEDDECDGWWIETGLLEVSTQACKYFSMSYTQDSLMSASPQPLDVLHQKKLVIKGGLAHDILSIIPFDENNIAMAHVAFAIHQKILWEKDIIIPSPSNYYSFQFETPSLSSFDLNEDAVFTIHLHNHGANQWRWLPIKIGFDRD